MGQDGSEKGILTLSPFYCPCLKKSCDSPPLSVRTQVESSGSDKAETPCRCEVGLKKDLSEGGEMPPFRRFGAKVTQG